MPKEIKIVNLAIQGGSSHGAFTWGVVDRILEEKDITIEGLSGTSAGGMNAAAIAQGLLKNGNQGARDELSRYWEMLINHANQYELPDSVHELIDPFGFQKILGYQYLQFLQRSFSPYQWNPININPLKTIVEDFFDFELLRSSSFIKLFLSTTHVKTGKPRIFQSHELSPEVLLASACLPKLFHAVEIDGEEYWDGGYIANPAIYPLIYNCQSRDIIVITLKPMHINEHPKLSEDIKHRLNQITFNSCLLREMRMIYYMSELIDHGFFKNNALKRVYMHKISNDDFFSNLPPHSTMDLSRSFIEKLFYEGRKTGESFIQKHKNDLCQRGTADLANYFQDE